MVQITFLMVAVIMAITPVAQAGGCTPGLTYCGRTLLEYGKKERGCGPFSQCEGKVR